MLWYWLIKFVQLVVLLFKLPQPAQVARIAISARCPVCGHTDGKLAAVPGVNNGQQGVYCLHTCNICGGRWFEQPVLKTDAVIPAAGSATMIDSAFLAKAVSAKGESLTGRPV